MVQLVLAIGSQIRLAPYKSFWENGRLVRVFFMYICLLLSDRTFSQTCIALRSEIGLSAPIGVSQREVNLIYEHHPMVSNWQALHFSYIRHKNLFRLQLGATTLGYSSNTTQGFTPSPEISSGLLGPGVPIDLRAKTRLTYVTLGISYGRIISKKISISSGLHYLKVVSVKSSASYTFPESDINALVGFGYTDTYEYHFTKRDQEFEQFQNGWAAALQWEYAMTKRFFLCGSYLIGFSEFSPFAIQPDTRDRLHQNFGIGLEYRFKL